MNAFDGVMATLLFAAAVKVTVVLGLAAIIVKTQRNWSAGMRHLVWSGSIRFLALLALASFAPPMQLWSLRCLPPVQHVPLTGRRSVVPQAQPRGAAPHSFSGGSPNAYSSHAGKPSFVFPAVPPTRRSAIPTTSAAAHPQYPAAHGSRPDPITVNWLQIVGGVWLLGTLIVCAWLLAALVRLRQAREFSEPAPERMQQFARESQAHLSFHRSVQLLRSGERCGVDVPVTWGARGNAQVLLPRHCDTWTDECLRVSILHEMVHIRRGDWTDQLLASIACALCWFNPFVWYAASQLRAESEHACDDIVLVLGTSPATYAQNLVHVARLIRRSLPAAKAAVAMARPNNVEERIKVLLDRTRDHSPVKNNVLRCSMWIAATLSLLVGWVQLTSAVATSIVSSIDPSLIIEDMRGDILSSLQGKPVPAGFALVRRGTGSLVFLDLPQVSTRQFSNRPYLTVSDDKSNCRFESRATGQTIRQGFEIRNDLTALLARGTQPRAGAEPYQLPFDLTFSTGIEPQRDYLTSSQIQEVVELTQEAQAWTSLLRGAEVVIDDGDINAVSFKMEKAPSSFPTLTLTLSADGGEKLASYTRSHIGRVMAILIDQHLLSVPTIVQPIEDGQLMISSGGTTNVDSERIAALIPSHLYCLLPTSATSPSITKSVGQLIVSSKDHATLPNGYTLRVDGVAQAEMSSCQWDWSDHDQPAWNTAGIPLKQPYALSADSYGHGSMLANGGLAPYTVYYSLIPPRGREGLPVSCIESTAHATSIDGQASYTCSETPGSENRDQFYVPPGIASCTTYIGVGAGPWRTIASQDIYVPTQYVLTGLAGERRKSLNFQINLGNSPTITCNAPGEPPYTSSLTLPSMSLNDSVGRRIVVVDDRGQQMALNTTGRGAILTATSDGTYNYHPHPTERLDHITKMLIQTHPVQMAEFTNIALKPRSIGQEYGSSAVSNLGH